MRTHKKTLGQKRRYKRKIAKRSASLALIRHEILFRKFSNNGIKLQNTEMKETIFLVFDESIIAYWHEYHMKMKNILFLQF